jgi:hypothetical protein
VAGRQFEVISDTEHCVVNVTLVMSDCPFGALLGPDRIGPAESNDTRTDENAETSGFRFDTAAPRTTGPRWCRFEQCRRRGDRVGAGEPQPQGVDRAQLPGRDPIGDRLADIFGAYNKPAGLRPACCR